MAWQFTRRHQEALWGSRQGRIGGSAGKTKGQSRWAYHPPPWRRWVYAAMCVAGMAWGSEAGAQTGSAPFVFEGGVLRIDTPGWESDTDYVVAAPAYVEVAEGVDAHMRGNIGRALDSWNGLYKLGAGTLRLSGATSYQGSTQLLQGGLHVDGSGVYGLWGGIEAIKGTQLEYSPGVKMVKPLMLNDTDIGHILPPGLYTPVAPRAGLEDAVGWRVASGRAEHAGLLQGSAPFVKLGSGLLDISEDAMAYFGQARVAEGALAINEIFSGSIVVNRGARLQGTGSVGLAHVQGGATLAPGNPVGAVNADNGMGRLVVMGDLRFDPGSRFEIDAAPTGESDSAWVGGKALLDGQVAVLARDGVWQPSTSYSILSAQGGFDESRFASVVSDLAFLTPSLEYGADSGAETVTLTLVRNAKPIDDVGETPDEKEVGRVIDEDDDTKTRPTPATPEKPGPGLHDNIVGLDRDNARQALRQLTGSWNASVLSSVWDDSRFLREAVLNQSMMLLPWVEAFHSDQV